MFSLLQIVDAQLTDRAVYSCRAVAAENKVENQQKKGPKKNILKMKWFTISEKLEDALMATSFNHWY